MLKENYNDVETLGKPALASATLEHDSMRGWRSSTSVNTAKSLALLSISGLNAFFPTLFGTESWHSSYTQFPVSSILDLETNIAGTNGTSPTGVHTDINSPPRHYCALSRTHSILPAFGTDICRIHCGILDMCLFPAPTTSMGSPTHPQDRFRRVVRAGHPAAALPGCSSSDIRSDATVH